MILTDDIINELKENVMDIIEGCCITLKNLYQVINNFGINSEESISLKYLVVTLELLEEENKVYYDEEQDLWCYKL
tara:strand:+ start:988 stop:1215 length:228 start_codon:yes stop_codon:yes gene_type:complete